MRSKPTLPLKKILRLCTPKRTLSAAIILVLLLHSFPAGFNADFFAINGDFQNYNVIRHLLDGQLPFRDFAVYLGAGHLYLGTLLSIIFGLGKASFVASKVAFSFAAFSSLAIMAYLSSSSIFHKKSSLIPLSLTLVLLILLHLDSGFFKSFLCISEDFYESLTGALKTGNSARFFRSLAPAFYILLVFLLKFIFSRKPNFSKKHRELVVGLIFGLPAGAIVFFSNDAGLSTVFCASFLFFFASISQRLEPKNLCKRFLFFGLSLLVSFLVFGELITLGHIDAYIINTFSTGDSQSWYYLFNETFYITQFDNHLYIFLQVALCVVYFVFLLKRRATTDAIIRYGIPLLLNMSCCLSANLYMLVSGNQNHGVALSVFYCTVVSEVALFLHRIVMTTFKSTSYAKFKKLLYRGLLIIVSVFIINSGLTLINDSLTQEKGAYVENVGQLTTLASSILSTDDFLRPEDTIFSTYASALELHRGSLQPSGYDYIIHVLGDKSRDDYLNSFRETNPDYVTTINPVYTSWEYWIKNANHFFYRELYRDYEPVYANNYQVFWKKKDTSHKRSEYDISQASIETTQTDNNTAIIKIKAPGVRYGVADIDLNYLVRKDGSKKSLLTHKTYLKVTNDIKTTDTYHNQYYSLPKTPSKHPQIGITIIDGEGQITISSTPLNSTILSDVSTKINSIYTDGVFSSVTSCSAEYNKDKEELSLQVLTTAEATLVLKDAKTVSLSDHKHQISYKIAPESEMTTIKVLNVKEEVAKDYLNHAYCDIFELGY